MNKILVSSANGENLTLSDSLTISEADELLGVFRSLVSEGKGSVTLNLEGVSSVDITFFQLLVSLKKTLALSNRSLAVKGIDPQGSLARTAALVGMSFP